MDSEDVPNFQEIYNSSKPNSLHGRKLRVVGLADPSYAYQLTLKTLPDGSYDFNSGYTYDLLKLLQLSINFSYIPIKGEGWSDLLPNGSWTGIGRQVWEGEADLSIAQSTFLDFNVKAFDYLFPTSKGFLVASFQQPPSNSVRNIITTPFPPNLWAALFVSAFVFIGSLKLFGIFTQRASSQEIEEPSFGRDAGYWVLVTFCQRGLANSPHSIPLRILYIFLAFLCIIIYVVFNAALVSTLSLELLPIKSFKDLVRSDIPIFGDESLPFTHDNIRDIINDQRMHQRKPKITGQLDPSNFISVVSGVKKIVDGRGLIVTFEDALQPGFLQLGVGDEFVCGKVFKLSVPGARTLGGMMLRKGNGLREIFNPTVARLIERGFVTRFRAIWYTALFPRCVRHPNSGIQEGEALNILDVVTVFQLLLLGGIGGFLMLILERVWVGRKNIIRLRAYCKALWIKIKLSQ